MARNGSCSDSRVIAMDLGGTKVAAAIADGNGVVMAEFVEPTDPRGAVPVARQIEGLVLRLLQHVGADLAAFRGCVIGVPAAVDPTTLRLSQAANISGLEGYDLTQYLSRKFRADFVLENDANLALLGEIFAGGGQGCSNIALITVGTGVGMGVFINGQLVRGAKGAAGEIAYLPIGADLTSSDALTAGAFELEVGSFGILKRYRRRACEEVSNVREVFDLAANGNSEASSVLRETARSLAIGIVAVHAILDLEMVLLGGGIGSRQELLSLVQNELVRFHVSAPPLRPCALGVRAGLIGAVHEAARRFGRSE